MYRRWIKTERLPTAFRAGVLALLIAFAVASSERASSAPRDRAADLRGEVESLSESLQDSRARFDAAVARASAADRRETAIASRVESSRSRLAALRLLVVDERRKAAAAGRSLARARESLAGRMVEIYMAGTPRVGDLLLASGDFGDLASRSTYLEAIGDSDRALAERVAQLRRARLESLRLARAGSAAVSSRIDELEAELVEVAAVREEARRAATGLASIQESRAGEIDRLRERIEEIESRQRPTTGSSGPSFAGGPYSIPTYIVMCESGGNYSALNPSSGAGGAYQIIPSTWEAYGGEGLPHLAPKAEQDRIAALIWANDGPGAWVCS